MNIRRLRFLCYASGSFASNCQQSMHNLMGNSNLSSDCNCVNGLKFPHIMSLTITDPEIFWSSLRDNLLEVIPADTFRVWFDNIRVGRFDEDGCELITPNEFSAIWIRDNYLDIIRREVDRLVERPFTVELLGDINENTSSGYDRISSAPSANSPGKTRQNGPARSFAWYQSKKY